MYAMLLWTSLHKDILCYFVCVSGEHKFECNQCDYKTNLKISYTDHMKKHAGIDYIFCALFLTFNHLYIVY